MSTNLKPDVKHPLYELNMYYWQLLNILYKGEKAVKDSKTICTPMPGGMESDEFKNFIERGEFYNAFFRTVQGLNGSIFRKDVVFTENIHKDLETALETISADGRPPTVISRLIGCEVLKNGRCGVFVDMDDTNKPFWSFYDAAAIINWKTRIVNSREELHLLVLQEQYAKDDTQVFTHDTVDMFKVYMMIEGHCVYMSFIEDDSKSTKGSKQFIYVDEPTILIGTGAALTGIPFVFFGTDNLSANPNRPPLLDVGFINLAHWRKSVDLAHGLHFAALPTPWAAGFDKNVVTHIGPPRVWVSEEVNARAGYLEFTGKGLEAIEKALDRNESQMATLGAKPIDRVRNQVETAEAARIHSMSETATLASIAMNIACGLDMCVYWTGQWMRIETTKVRAEVNTDFVDTELSPNDIASLVKALQADGMSLDTFLYNLKRGELMPPGRSIEEEKELIIAEKETFTDFTTPEDEPGESSEKRG